MSCPLSTQARRLEPKTQRAPQPQHNAWLHARYNIAIPHMILSVDQPEKNNPKPATTRYNVAIRFIALRVGLIPRCKNYKKQIICAAILFRLAIACSYPVNRYKHL